MCAVRHFQRGVDVDAGSHARAQRTEIQKKRTDEKRRISRALTAFDSSDAGIYRENLNELMVIDG